MTLANSRSTHEATHGYWSTSHQPLVSLVGQTRREFPVDDRASLAAKAVVWIGLSVLSLGVWIGAVVGTRALIGLIWAI
jgi:hypothetical protein